MKTKEEMKEYHKERYKNNKEKTKQKYEDNKEVIKEKRRQYYQLNKEKRKQYYELNKELNKEKNKEKNKDYYKNNKEKIKKYNNIYKNNKKKTDPLFKLKCNLRNRIREALKKQNYIKSKTTIDMLGCDSIIAKAHLEKQFTKGMSWENYGEWHIDHIIPCASAKTEEELIKLFHYTNLQPLWAADNMSKGKKIIEKQLFLL